jgi:hypothetical protein
VETELEKDRRRQIGAEIVEGYERYPETEEELERAAEITKATIEEEPW